MKVLKPTPPLNKIRLLIWIGISALFFNFMTGSTSSAYAKSVRCESALAATTTSEPYVRTTPALNLKEIPDGHYMLGYESEYTFAEAGPILRDYAPLEDVMPLKKWKKMTDQQHIEWLKSQFSEKPEFATDAGLRPIVKLPFTPREVIVDSTGNLEIVSNPMSSYQEWETFVDTVVGRYGAGSQQAMVSKPREEAFGGQSPAAQGQLTKAHLGWLIYTNLRDMFSKLESGYQRYKTSPDKLTALSFDHPFVGPMNKIKRDKLEEFLKGNVNGKNYDEASVKFVRKSDASFKYTSGPSYRPDVAGLTRFAWEIRNAHKDVADLKMKVRRDMDAHHSDLKPYSEFADVPAFDSIGVFAALPKQTQDGLIEIFPSKADPNFIYEESEHRSLETFRNFALPLMDFSKLAQALANLQGSDGEALGKQVTRAQITYRTELIHLVSNYQDQKSSLAQTRAALMGSVGKFSEASGLARSFEQAAKRLGTEDATDLPLMAKGH